MCNVYSYRPGLKMPRGLLYRRWHPGADICEIIMPRRAACIAVSLFRIMFRTSVYDALTAVMGVPDWHFDEWSRRASPDCMHDCVRESYRLLHGLNGRGSCTARRSTHAGLGLSASWAEARVGATRCVGGADSPAVPKRNAVLRSL